MAAARTLAAEGIGLRVVSMPNVGRFLALDEEYRNTLLPPAIDARVVIEAGVRSGWYRFAGLRGVVIGVDRFGASAPAKQLFEHYGLTAERVCAAVRALLNPDPNMNPNLNPNMDQE